MSKTVAVVSVYDSVFFDGSPFPFFLQSGTSMRTHPFTGLILAFNYLPEPSKLCEFEGKISRVLWISVENGPRTLILGEGARTIATTL